MPGSRTAETDANGTATLTLAAGRHTGCTRRRTASSARSPRGCASSDARSPRSPLTVASASAGCGFGEGEAQDGGADLRVTKDFGHEELAADKIDTVHEDETRHAPAPVASTTSRRASAASSWRRSTASRAPAAPARATGSTSSTASGPTAARRTGRSHAGDVIQWDNRDWSATQRIPAIVGAYPEPFRSGTRGRAAAGAARVRRRGRRGVPRRQGLADRRRRARQLVAARAPRAARSSSACSSGRGTSCATCARPRCSRRGRRRAECSRASPTTASGSSCSTRTATSCARPTPGTGLVAATALEEQAVVWIVTGLDDVGVQAAAAVARRALAAQRVRRGRDARRAGEAAAAEEDGE